MDAPLLVLLLDGVAHARMANLHARGHFRRFGPPARLISVFPTLTDPAYDVLFGTGPTPGYEAGYFDRATNRTMPGLWSYVRGENEQWVRQVDYRLNFVEDGLMYLLPRQVFASELRRAGRVARRKLAAGCPQTVVYVLSTDALGHMLPSEAIEAHLTELDGWIEDLCGDHKTAPEIVMLADHGISALPPTTGHVRPFDLPGALRNAGLRVVSRLRRTGDVAVPLFGLLDVGRIHTFDADTRRRAVAALRERAEIEVLAERDGDSVRVYAAGDRAEIRMTPGAEPGYAYVPLEGDPLGLGGVAERPLTAREWLLATSDHEFPAGPSRLWDGLCRLCREQPDVVVSLRERWFVGSGLFNGLVRMHGTHGGLHRRVSETFIMATGRKLAGPLSLAEARELLMREFNWRPGGRR